MENSQVTIAVQAHGLRGRLGRPILIVCEATDAAPQQFVWLRGTPAGTFEANRVTVAEGPLGASMVELLQVVTERELYTALLFWKGVQAELETSAAETP